MVIKATDDIYLAFAGSYALTPAYNTTIVCRDGATIQLKSRERPQLLLRNGTPTVLYNAVAEGVAEGGKDFTLAQLLGPA